jgi:hypothetical protein
MSLFFKKTLPKIDEEGIKWKRNNRTKNIKKCLDDIKKIVNATFEFSTQKTLQLFKKGISITQIAKQRNIEGLWMN